MFRRKETEEEGTGLEFFTVYDSKAKIYNEPFPAQNREVILREFTNAFRKPDAAEKNRYYINAEDYSIFRCGKFDVTTGRLAGAELEHVVNLHDLRAIASPAREMGIVPT